MNIRLIKTNADYVEALAEVRRLWNAAPGSDDASKLEVLAMLIQRYERERAPLPPVDPIEAITFRMEQQGLSRKDLLPILGTTGRTSEVFSRKRPLTLGMIRKLHALLDIPLESLMQPLQKAKPRQRRGAAPGATPARRGRRRAAA
jgi:HTH-type transcriptional regulator/antitoxin HigA